MFSDKFGLTQAVLEGRKTMTRRFAEKVLVEDENGELHWNGEFKPSRYKVGEVVSVAQNLRDMGYNPRDTKHRPGAIWGLDHSVAWTNKMFVSASECIHQIRITNVRVDRLQDISDEDCLREGIRKVSPLQSLICLNASTYQIDGPGCENTHYTSPRGAFAGLIDKVSCKGTWGNNPWVFVYEFELVQ